MRILGEDLLLVDPGEGIGERRQERRRRPLQPKDHRGVVRRLDLVDHGIEADPRADRSLGREDDAAPAIGHVDGRQLAAVVEFHALADLEGVGLAVVGRLGHLGAEIADEFGGRGGIVGRDADQHTVERRHGMHGSEGRLAMTVEARRSVCRYHVGQRAASFGRTFRQRGDRRHRRQRNGGSPHTRPNAHRFLQSTVLFSLPVHFAAGHPMARAYFSQLRPYRLAGVDRLGAARMEHAARWGIDG